MPQTNASNAEAEARLRSQLNQIRSSQLKVLFSLICLLLAVILFASVSALFTFGTLAFGWCMLRIQKSISHLLNNYKILRTLGLLATMACSAAACALSSEAIASFLQVDLTLAGAVSPLLGQIALIAICTFAAVLLAKYLFKAISFCVYDSTNPQKRELDLSQFRLQAEVDKGAYDDCMVALSHPRNKPKNPFSMLWFTYCGHQRALINRIIHQLRQGKIQAFIFAYKASVYKGQTEPCGPVTSPYTYFIYKACKIPNPLPQHPGHSKKTINENTVENIFILHKHEHELYNVVWQTITTREVSKIETSSSHASSGKSTLSANPYRVKFTNHWKAVSCVGQINGLKNALTLSREVICPVPPPIPHAEHLVKWQPML